MVEEIFVKSFKQGPIEFAVTKKCLLIDWLNFQWYNAVDIRKWYTIHYFTQEVHHSDLEISKLGKLSEIHQKKQFKGCFDQMMMMVNWCKLFLRPQILENRAKTSNSYEGLGFLMLKHMGKIMTWQTDSVTMACYL